VFVRITVHYPARGITSTIAIAVGPRHVYNVIYKGAKNKIVTMVGGHGIYFHLSRRACPRDLHNMIAYSSCRPLLRLNISWMQNGRFSIIF